ncbi:MAG: hypothetical protein N3D80_09710 [Ignavibacterium album]|uniref:hypothetical protein n=1 Tax=Ignavibacterium album TaxID=591197 RepID=UPI0026EBB0D2|nr:hypothetical protein [Ignavibacterium album]MCX8106131.1 hypothetical protein [Ignavibacterium album]
MKRAIILTIVSMFLFISFSCKENGITPPEDKPGRRDYTWTVDTLKPPESHRGVPFYISNIWGSSPNDMWAVCSGFSPLILLWHYDGYRWSLWYKQLGRDLYGICGFTWNNVWIGDAENSIWHFDGVDWSKSKSLSLQGFDRVLINYIWGISPSDIYAVGFADQYNGGSEYKGILLHYDGNDWNFVNIPDIRAGFYKIVRKTNTNELLIYGFSSDYVFIDKLFAYNGKDIIEISSGIDILSLEEMKGEVFVTIERKIYRYNDGKLNFWMDFPGTSFLVFKGGRSEKDFFGASIEGLLHYNGTDLQVIFKTYPRNIGLYRVFIFENDIFITAYDEDAQLNLIIRGTLKNN